MFRLYATFFFGLFALLIFVPHASSTGNAPVVDSVVVSQTSGGNESAINLSEASTQTVYVRGAITDLDGCEDVTVNGSTMAKLFRSNVSGGQMCTFDRNDCIQSNGCYYSGCEGVGDSTVNVECSFTVYYHADSTTTGTYSGTDWTGGLRAQDSEALFGASMDTIEVNTLTAVDVTSSINYGTLAFDSTSTQQTLTVTNTGNGGLDVRFSAPDFSCNGEGSAGFPSSYLHYSGNIAHTWAQGTALSSTPSAYELNLAPLTNDGGVASSPVYFYLRMPSSGLRGTCSTNMTVTAIADSGNGW